MTAATTAPMSSIIRGALRHARIEVRLQLLSWSILSWLLWPAIGFGVLFFLRGQQVMDTAITLAQVGVPGIIAMYLVTGGFMGTGSAIVTEREDGTLLRAKAVPGGMSSHLLGTVLVYSLVTLVPTALTLGVAALLFEGVAPSGMRSWWVFAWVSVLGLFATLPIGAVAGSLFRGAMGFAYTSMVVYASMAISGIFYPLAALPGWLQIVGKLLPTYWIGLGMRQALLPPEAVALEVGATWNTGMTVLALLAWAAIGLTLAPIALRRMARRQSGSQVAAARERVMTRGY